MTTKLKRVVIKQELVELTGDFRPALILNQFIYWSERMFDTDNYIKEERERATKENITIEIEESNGWIYKSAEELNEELMVGMSAPTIRKYIKQLIEQGFLYERRNPKYKWDKKMQYRVDLYKVQLELAKIGYALEGYALLPGITIQDTQEINKEQEETPGRDLKDLKENEVGYFTQDEILEIPEFQDYYNDRVENSPYFNRYPKEHRIKIVIQDMLKAGFKIKF